MYDGVVGPWYLPTFARACGLATVDYVVLMPSVERCLEGVRTRLNHGFSDEDVTRKMHQEFADAEVDDRHVLDDPPGDIDAVVAMIRSARETRRLRVLASRSDQENVILRPSRPSAP